MERQGRLTGTGATIATAAALIALAIAAPAQASTAQVVSGQLQVDALPGERNAIALTVAGSTVTVQDSGANVALLLPGPGCLPVVGATDRVTCDGVTAIDVDAGDQDDVVRNDTAAPATIQLGAGNDTAVAGASTTTPDAYADLGGVDTLDYSARETPLAVTAGEGSADDGGAGEGDTVPAEIERLRGGAAGDDLRARDRSASRTLEGHGGADRLEAGGRDDVLHGGEGDDVVMGGEGSDVLEGGAGNDTLVGGPVPVEGEEEPSGFPELDGSDRLRGGPGADSLTGGGVVDFDTAVYGERSAGQPVTVTIGAGEPGTDGEAGEGDEVAAGVESVEGGAGDDVLVGDASDNDLLGGPGNDRLDGGLGSDYLEGQAGDGDVADYAGGARQAGVTVTIGDAVPDGSAEDGAGDFVYDVEEVRGTAHADTLTGGDGPQTLLGLGGADTLDGGFENDVVDGGDGADAVAGGEGDDVLVGGLGSDRLDGGDGADDLRSRDGVADVDDCGADADKVTAETLDTVNADCETVDLGTRTKGGKGGKGGGKPR